MSGPIAAFPVEQITSGAQLFRCVPYSCTMLARACVERQAKVDLGLDTIALLKCKGCELGAEVMKLRGYRGAIEPTEELERCANWIESTAASARKEIERLKKVAEVAKNGQLQLNLAQQKESA